MNAATLPHGLPSVLKLAAILFVGWLGLWLATGVVLWLTSGTYEGKAFIFVCGRYGVPGAIVFALCGALAQRYGTFSWWRGAASAWLAGVVALPAVWHILRDSPVEHFRWVCFVAVAVGVLFGLLLRWLSSLLCRSKGETHMA